MPLMFTQDDLNKLDAAIASNTAAEVQFADGQRIRYRSVGEMLTARQHVAAVLAERQRRAGMAASGGVLYPVFVHSRER